MDIFAHTLWANAAARGANAVAENGNKNKKKKFHMHVGWTAFFGVAPDLFAFAIPFALRFFGVLFSGNAFSSLLHRPPVEGGEFQNGFNLAHNLYQYSHSLVIWVLVFALVWAFYKRPQYELLGWALHILIDIPTHVLAFFPTPFLFPISDYKFQYGMQWSNQWFMIVNYSLLLVVWGRILFKDLAKKYNLFTKL